MPSRSQQNTAQNKGTSSRTVSVRPEARRRRRTKKVEPSGERISKAVSQPESLHGIVNILADDNCTYNVMLVMFQLARALLHDPDVPQALKDTIHIFNSDFFDDALTELAFVFQSIETKQGELTQAVYDSVRAHEGDLREDSRKMIVTDGGSYTNEAYFTTRYKAQFSGFANFLLNLPFQEKNRDKTSNGLAKFDQIFDSKLKPLSFRRRQELMAIALRRAAMKPFILKPNQTTLSDLQMSLLISALNDYEMDGKELKFRDWEETVMALQSCNREELRLDKLMSEWLWHGFPTEARKEFSEPLQKAFKLSCDLIRSALYAKSILRKKSLEDIDWAALGRNVYEQNISFDNNGSRKGLLKDYSMEDWDLHWQKFANCMKHIELNNDHGFVDNYKSYKALLKRRIQLRHDFYPRVFTHFRSDGVWPHEDIYKPALVKMGFPVFGDATFVLQQALDASVLTSLTMTENFWGIIHNVDRHYNVVAPKYYLDKYADQMGAGFTRSKAIAYSQNNLNLPQYYDPSREIPGFIGVSTKLYFDDLIPNNEFRSEIDKLVSSTSMINAGNLFTSGLEGFLEGPVVPTREWVATFDVPPSSVIKPTPAIPVAAQTFQTVLPQPSHGAGLEPISGVPNNSSNLANKQLPSVPQNPWITVPYHCLQMLFPGFRRSEHPQIDLTMKLKSMLVKSNRKNLPSDENPEESWFSQHAWDIFASVITLVSGAGLGFGLGYIGLSVIGGTGAVAGAATMGVGFGVALGVLLLVIAINLLIPYLKAWLTPKAPVIDVPEASGLSESPAQPSMTHVFSQSSPPPNPFLVSQAQDFNSGKSILGTKRQQAFSAQFPEEPPESRLVRRYSLPARLHEANQPLQRRMSLK